MSAGSSGFDAIEFAVVMAGGRGTRFWPLSRARRAKHLLPLVGGKTLVELTVERLLPLFDQRRIILVTQQCQIEATREALKGFSGIKILSEPVGKNTAACIALAVSHLLIDYPDCVVALMPADHFIERCDRFRELLKKAMEFAWKKRMIVTLGIKPNRVATGFGYIEIGESLEKIGDDTIYKVLKFTEKPDETKAKQFVESGRFLWNAGIFVSRASVMMDEIRRWLPRTAAEFDRYIKADDNERQRILEQAYPVLEDISIDFGVMEKSDIVAVLPAEIGWDDVGSWESYAKYLSEDTSGNKLYGMHIGIDTSNSIIYTDSALVATLGIKDIMVIATGDSILIADRRRCEEVRRIVDMLDKKGLGHLL